MGATLLEPRTAQEAAAMLAQASADGASIVPCGRRTRLGPARERDRPTSMSSLLLTGGYAHYAGDLVATLPAGMTLADANAALAAERQWLPLDPLSSADTTIGGLVASNDSGPRRHGYGAPRDLVIGIEVALTSGAVAHSGGRVVKNVAGYDLGRLFCGSKGSLGVITSITFKLAPLPPASRTLICRYRTTADAAAAALVVARSPLTPSCLEVVAPDPRLLIRFESTPASAFSMAAAAAALLAGADDVATVEGDAEAATWETHRAAFATAPCIDKFCVLPASVPQVLAGIAALGEALHLSARPALGVMDLAFPTPREASARHLLASYPEAHVDVTRAPADASRSSTPRGGSGAVMDAVKRQFDPAGILPYPWERG